MTAWEGRPTGFVFNCDSLRMQFDMIGRGGIVIKNLANSHIEIRRATCLCPVTNHAGHSADSENNIHRCKGMIRRAEPGLSPEGCVDRNFVRPPDWQWSVCHSGCDR